MEHLHKVFTREEVIKAIGSSTEFSTNHFLNTHASRLRLKIKRVGGPKVIMGVRGVGYRLIAAHGSNEEPHTLTELGRSRSLATESEALTTSASLTEQKG